MRDGTPVVNPHARGPPVAGVLTLAQAESLWRARMQWRSGAEAARRGPRRCKAIALVPFALVPFALVAELPQGASGWAK